jgi:hypothetical protein
MLTTLINIRAEVVNRITDAVSELASKLAVQQWHLQR